MVKSGFRNSQPTKVSLLNSEHALKRQFFRTFTPCVHMNITKKMTVSAFYQNAFWAMKKPQRLTSFLMLVIQQP